MQTSLAYKCGMSNHIYEMRPIFYQHIRPNVTGVDLANDKNSALFSFI